MGKYAGDFIADALTAIGIKKCGGCARRQQKINDLDKRVRSAVRGKGKKR